ncbi:MAG: thioredoxin domain-containing protein [Bdellovibrionales bacterium]|nr:thioredoxin domain-containing protein [Bdellovibrionales bacterium]
MRKSTLIALISTVVAIIFHTLLTLHYYPLRFGLTSEKSSCSVNALFDCDAVSTSAFSSFIGVPLSLWGLVTNAILLVFIFGLIVQVVEDQEKHRRTTAYLAAFIGLMSIVMGIISATQLSTYCLFCLGTYLTSFITWAALHMENNKNYWNYFPSDLASYLGASRGYLIFVGLLPVVSYISHRSIVQHFSADKIDEIVLDSVNQWKSSPTHEFNGPITLTKGAKDSFMTITEFADFQCGHCRHASLPLGSFARSHTDIKFNFVVFPLDGDCNEAVKQGRGTSCRLAKAAYCAGKENPKLGWVFHDSIYADQDKFPITGTIEKIDKELKEIIKDTSVNWDNLTQCMNSEETQEKILAMAKMGENAEVKGTPTIFVNGRYLPRGQLIPVLQSVYSDLKK